MSTEDWIARQAKDSGRDLQVARESLQRLLDKGLVGIGPDGIPRPIIDGKLMDPADMTEEDFLLVRQMQHTTSRATVEAVIGDRRGRRMV